MPNTFETLELDAGSGGGKVAGDQFTQSAVVKFMPSSTLAVPDGAGDFDRVGDSGITLPVTEENSAAVLAALGLLAAEDGGNLAALVAGLTTLIGHVDGLEGQVTTVTGHVDGIEGQLTTLAGHVDGLEALLTTLAGHVDTLETLLAAATPAGTNLIGQVAAGADASNRYSGATALVPKFANIDCASSGDNQLVAAVASRTIRVISVFLAAAGAVDVKFNDGTAALLGGTRLIKLDNTGAVGAGGFCLQENRTGWFQTAAVNRPINLNLSSAVGVAGCITYVEVP
jgi:hypothetical protein